MSGENLPDWAEELSDDWRQHLAWLLVPPTADEIVEKFPDAAGCSMLAGRDKMLCRWSRFAHYYVMRLNGGSHRFAEMVAMQQCATGMTDDIFFAGFPMLADQFRTKRELDNVIAAAKRQGYKPSANDVYMPNLAKCKGDPAAFVSRSDGRQKIKDVVEKRGWACEGGITSAGREQDPGEGVALAEDIVQSTMRETVAADPDMAKLDRQELREHVIEKHGMK